MDTKQIQKLWQSSVENSPLAGTSLQADAEAITKGKIRTFVSSMKPITLFTILAGMVWVAIIGFLVGHLAIYAYSSVSPFFLFSIGIQVVITAIALFFYIYQLIQMYKVDIADTILITQERLVRLKGSILWVTRILFLQLPVWTTFYWTDTMFKTGNPLLLTLQGLITTLFTILAIWLFINIRFENHEKKWFRLIFNGKEWTPVINALTLLEGLKNNHSEKTENGSIHPETETHL
jgi:hypothetical protein